MDMYVCYTLSGARAFRIPHSLQRVSNIARVRNVRVVASSGEEFWSARASELRGVWTLGDPGLDLGLAEDFLLERLQVAGALDDVSAPQVAGVVHERGEEHVGPAEPAADEVAAVPPDLVVQGPDEPGQRLLGQLVLFGLRGLVRLVKVVRDL